jgi:NLI interacting factor-like phosphatase.
VKPLLVLDINGILCHRVRDSKPPAPLVLLTSMHQGRDINIQSLYRERIGRIAQTDIIPRTDLEEFLDFLVEHYNLALWSSAKKKTVKRLMHLMFPERIQKRLIFVWGQEKCECLTSSQEKDTSVQKSSAARDDVGGDGSEVIFMKHLSKVWNEFPLWNRSNTLLVDDSPEKCVKYKENAIHPPPIMGLNVDALARYMESLQVTDDVNRTKVDLDVACYSDEDNQKKQLQFFQDLTAAWRSPKEDGDEVLMKFLSNNGRCRMNWNA